ncbi:MAG: DUF4145 domain-containing protein [Methanothrix sp.]|nr:DUF4145 domain-containing protein [Methanothrix sp.]
MSKVKARDIYGSEIEVIIDDEKVKNCPLCHISIRPDGISSFLNHVALKSDYLQKIYRCPNCNMIFLALFKQINPEGGRQIYQFERSEPYRPSEPSFPENIKSISSSFCSVYTQAKSAEEQGLSDICGVGYRKALEFLIKDYLISKKDELRLDEETIKKTSLGNCIKNHIRDAKVQEMAELATWLGNDETHYYRKFENKDLSDLKELIHLTMNTIDSNLIFEKHKKDMKPKA